MENTDEELTQSVDTVSAEQARESEENGQQNLGEMANQPPSTIWLIAFLSLLIANIAVLIFIELTRGSLLELALHSTLALSLAGLASIIPGFLHVPLSSGVKAGGAIAVFIVVLLLVPLTRNTDNYEPAFDLSGDYSFHLKRPDGEEIEGGNARIEHNAGSTLFRIKGDVPPHEIATDPDYIESAIITFESNFGMIDQRRIVFHYRTNLREEGIAVANHTGIEDGKRVLFNFYDYAEENRDGIPKGVLIFRRIE